MAEPPKQCNRGDIALNLKWPPSRAELERLYLDERLPTKRIADMYGLRTPYRVLRLLSANGIPTRRPGSVSKTTPEMIAEWVKRYQGGESTYQIARGAATHSTVRRFLLEQGLELRPRDVSKKMTRVRRDAILFGEGGAKIKALYLDEHLPPLQIARRLGLPCENQNKVAGMVYRHLKELGVPIYPTGYFNRKYDGVASEWVRRYNSGESPQKIAKGLTHGSVVVRRLRGLGVKLRDQSEAATEYAKSPFDGDEQERAYLLAFARGDLQVYRRSRLVRCVTGSTHAAQLDLFTALFAPFGPINTYPAVNRISGFNWAIYASLDSTFEFLLEKSDTSRISEGEVALCYLAGLFDAEGCLFLQSNCVFSPDWILSNSDSRMLDWAMDLLTRLGFHPKRRKPNPWGVGEVLLQRHEEVVELLRILPLRHAEKKAKARLVLDERMRPEEKRDRWRDLITEIHRDRDEMIRAAEQELASRGRGADSVYGTMACLRYLSHWKKFPLDESIWPQTLNWLREYVDE
jgi:hypothetical protein